jgi:hypothetical protein
MLKASKPGQPAVRVDKRTGDELVFEIDCSDLLTDTRHILFGKATVSHAPDIPINIVDARAKQGKYLSFKAVGGPTIVPYVDYLVHFSLSRTDGSKLSIPVTIRCYSH